MRCLLLNEKVQFRGSGTSLQIFNIPEKMAAADDSLYPIAVLIDELRNEDVQVSVLSTGFRYLNL